MRPKSNTLFHFTKDLETLKLILQNGFWPRYCLEDVGWLGGDDDYIAYPMVCFCDIPLSRISEHVGFYGQFGIGLTRSWAEDAGLNPLLYVAGENGVYATIQKLVSNATDDEDPERSKAARASVLHMLAYSKPVSGKMVVGEGPVDKLFYQESEWRYVPKGKGVSRFITKANFDDASQRDRANAKTREGCMLRFGPKDVRYIFVKSDSDIPDVVNFIHAHMDRYTGSEQKILMSRVVSLESLSEDL
ncbi:abortive infection system antitoxin AbiGi family protein [Cupriavidus sp. USMAA2-4]|uniref:abortive infection system antitoxin AbiGi family protein n=1 Tax=Cupriavidus sp. USMAA2-4 TaxID=876364 RepID=UPI0009FBAC3E|nr:abortive infection system antitoxin AbiGi family protein [Cupriavidus sp. USMAA2-4]